MGFPRQKHWSGLPFPSPGNLNYQGVEHGPPALAGRFLNTPQQIYVTATWPLPPNVYSSHKVAISFVQIKGEPHESRVPPWDSSPTEYSTAPNPSMSPCRISEEDHSRSCFCVSLWQMPCGACWASPVYHIMMHTILHYMSLNTPPPPAKICSSFYFLCLWMDWHSSSQKPRSNFIPVLSPLIAYILSLQTYI